jgi:NADPH:quinone reductase-like Zn-dependent oxidoreductase
VYLKYGIPEVVNITEVTKPVPGNNEVLVKVHATSVNRTDCGFRSGKPYIVRLFSGILKPRQTILGSEFAGEVEAIGKDVQSFHVGDKVFGFHPDIFGAHAQYICLPEDASFTNMPQDLSYREAAAICEGDGAGTETDRTHGLNPFHPPDIVQFGTPDPAGGN